METENTKRNEPKARRRLWFIVWFASGLLTGYLAREIHLAFDTSYISQSLVTATHSHMGTVKTALKMFKVGNKDLPTTSEGITALVKIPSRFPIKSRFIQEDDIVDAWGTVFGYSRNKNDANPEFDLWSAGPDKLHFTADDIIYRKR